MHREEPKKITQGDMLYSFGLFGAGFGAALFLVPTLEGLSWSISAIFEVLFMIGAGAFAGAIAGATLAYVSYSIYDFFK